MVFLHGKEWRSRAPKSAKLMGSMAQGAVAACAHRQQTEARYRCLDLNQGTRFNRLLSDGGKQRVRLNAAGTPLRTLASKGGGYAVQRG